MGTQTANLSFMQKHKKLLIASGVTLLIIGGVITYYLYQKKKKNTISIGGGFGMGASQSSTSSSSSSGSSSSSRPPRPSGRLCQSSSYPLNYGTCSNDVKILQRYLQKQGAYLGSPAIDGKFGPKTLAAAKKYLKKSSFTLVDISRLKKKLKS